MSPNNNIRIVQEAPSRPDGGRRQLAGRGGGKIYDGAVHRQGKETGCCFASVHSSTTSAPPPITKWLLPRQDMIGFACTNLKGQDRALRRAAGARIMGTNPISVAAPSDDLPVVLDMAPSVVALGKLILAQKLGKVYSRGLGAG